MGLFNEFFNANYTSLIPIECFLNRVFPIGFYDEEIEDIVYGRYFKPRKDCSPFKLTLPIDWEGQKYNSDRNWRMQLQGWAMFHPVMNIFDSFDDKEALVGYFFDILTDWMDVHQTDDDYSTTSRMPSSYAWYDMSVGFRALVIAFFINRIKYFNIEIDDKEILILSRVSTKHMNNLCFEDAFSLNNHGLFQIQGLMALTHLTNFESNSDKKLYALKKMEELILSQFTREGIHKEHSPHYHFYATDTAISIIKTGWYSSSPMIEEIVQLANLNKCWMVDPLKRPVCIGDSILTVQKRLVLPEGTKKDVIVGEFTESGYAVVKSDWHGPVDKSHMLFLMGMYHSKSHKHRDCLSFELFDGGERLLCDSGKYGYRSDKYRNYFLSHRAHNTVEIEGFDIIKIKPYGTCLSEISQDSDGNYTMEGSLNYPAIKHKRILTYKPNNWLLVSDALEFARSRGFTQWFHLGVGFELVVHKERYFKFSNGNGKTVEIECLNESLKPILYNGDESEMQGFVSENDYVFEKAYAIGFSGSSKKSDIQTIIRYGEDTSYSKYSNLKFLDGASPSILEVKKLSEPVLKNIRNFFFESECLDIPYGKSTISTILDGIPFRFYSDRKVKSKGLMVMLPGATNRGKGCIDFQRHSWSDDFNCNIVSFSDPTICDENDLSIGWFQYKSDYDCIAALTSLVKTIASILAVKEEDIFIFGSSAGGFASLKLSERLTASSVLAINPQLYLSRYSRNHFESMVEYSYKDSSIEMSDNELHERIKVSPLNILERKSSTYIVQNSEDVKHYERHFKSFVTDCNVEDLEVNEIDNWENIVISDKLNMIVYSDNVLCHSPPNREDTVALVKHLNQFA